MGRTRRREAGATRASGDADLEGEGLGRLEAPSHVDVQDLALLTTASQVKGHRVSA